jgi:hypothetical protein
MKDTIKIIGIIAMAAVIGFSMAACDNNDHSSEKTLQNISIDTTPSKTAYQIGDTLDTTGMVVKAHYSDDSVAVITDYTMALDGTVIKHGDTISTMTYYGRKTVTVKKDELSVEFFITVIPPSANVGINVNAVYEESFLTGSNTRYYLNMVTVELTLPEGGEWNEPQDGFTDEQESAIKSWVIINSGTTIPSLDTWSFYTPSAYENKLRLVYNESKLDIDPVSIRGTVTASIVQSKVTEMKGYTNITGEFTASSVTARDSDWTSAISN